MGTAVILVSAHYASSTFSTICLSDLASDALRVEAIDETRRAALSRTGMVARAEAIAIHGNIANNRTR
jgi:hypothetical protein